MNIKIKTLRSTFIAVSLILLLPMIILAHNDQQHVMGTVTKIDAGSITVKTTAGEVRTVMILSNTKFVRGTAAVSARDLKIGDRVVIHAKPEREMLDATEVKIGAANGSMHHD